MSAADRAPGRGPAVHLVSLGCPKNLVDSQRMLGLLQGNGYRVTEDPLEAEVVVINTCAFIGPAKEESIDAVMAAHELRRQGRCRAVIVTGCLSTRYEEELRRELPEADDLLTIQQEGEIVARVDAALGSPPRTGIHSAPCFRLTPPHWAYLRISDGCDHRCSFCVIPAIRGPHHSEPMERLVEQAAELADSGVRELVLISQDSMRYGADLYGSPRLVPLLERLGEVRGLEWIRLMYTYPAYWTEPLMELFASHPRLCAYVDMPLQHISDPVLRRMRRVGDGRQIRDLVARLRERIPGLGLRSTFIVGFPGETEQQFQELLDFVQATRFDHVTGFVYSPEEGTPAFDLGDPVEEAEKEERYGRLSALQEEISAGINQDLVGTEHRVLVDQEDPDEGICYARMERDAPEIDGQVIIDQGRARVGSFVQVEITAGYAFERHGRISSQGETAS